MQRFCAEPIHVLIQRARTASRAGWFFTVAGQPSRAPRPLLSRSGCETVSLIKGGIRGDSSELRDLIKKQIELQEEANGLMRGLVGALQAVAQETQNLRVLMEDQDS
jgi:hypothetical protein